MKEVWFFLLANAFTISCIFRIFDGYFDRSQVDRRWEAAGFAVFFVGNSTVHLMFQNPQATGVSCVGSMLLITCLYPGSPWKKLAVCGGIYVAFTGSELLIYLLLSRWGWNPVSGPGFGTLIPVIGLLTLSLVLKKLHRTRRSSRMEFLDWLAIFLIPAGSVLLMVMVLKGGDREDMVLAMSTVLALINILVFHLFDSQEKYYRFLGTKQLLEQQNQAYANELALIGQNERQLSVLRHDLKNHLAVIRNFAAAGEMKALDEYLDSFTDRMTQKKEYVRSGNLELDSILNYKLEQAKEAGADMEVSVVLPQKLGVACFDINVMLGNLLDNAIAGIRAGKDKKLVVDIRMEMGILYLRMENSYNGLAEKKDGRYITSKRDRELHGIGLAAVEQTVEKYHGQMEVESGGDVFRVELILYPPDEGEGDL